MGYLDQQPGAVARVGIATASAAMLQVDENFYALVDNLVARAALDIGDKADTTGVVFKTGVVKALLRRQSVSRHILFSPSRASSPASTPVVGAGTGGNRNSWPGLWAKASAACAVLLVGDLRAT